MSLRISIRCSTVSLAAISALTAGCASNPARNVPDNGLPVRLLMRSGTGIEQVEVEDGRSVTTHASGAESETVNYKIVEQTYKWKESKLYLGSEELDEQDWFRLRDPAASAEIAAARESARRSQSIGLPLAVVGYAGILGGMAVTNESAAMGVYIVSGIVAAVGSGMYLKGYRTMSNKRLLPVSRAYEAADQVVHCENERCVPLKNVLAAPARRDSMRGSLPHPPPPHQGALRGAPPAPPPPPPPLAPTFRRQRDQPAVSPVERRARRRPR